MFRLRFAAQAAFTSFLCGLATASAFAQGDRPSAAAEPPLEVTVTANRIPTAIQRTGSAVTVIRREELERSSPASLTDALRSVPGLDITETGGPGQTSAIRLRGANAGQTLVLLDGVRLNDPTAAGGEFDPSLLAPGLIDRIEVLRGPQSALYGSDAIGGVINIITRRGRGAPSGSLRLETGSYGTFSATGTASGVVGPWTFAGAATSFSTGGFSTWGARIERLESQNGGRFEPDGTRRFGGFGRIGYDAGQGFRIDVGVLASDTRAEYDAGFGRFPDTPSYGRRRFSQISAKAELDTFGDRLTHSLQVFANRTERAFFDSSFGTLQPGNRLGAESRSRSDFIGDRIGAEYQATLRMDTFGLLTAGARSERETTDTFSRNLVPAVTAKTRTIAAEQTTNSAFALWQLPVGERLNLSLGGRHDQVSDAGGFTTWRTTAAYRIPETGTKLRASAGTGAKAPTLFQLFSPQFGTAALSPEQSFGYDAGIDQDLFDGKVTLSVTAFANRIRNLIDFTTGPRCQPTQTFGCYINVARANTAGLEAAARVELVDWLGLRANYTYLHAKDALTNLTLARRPQHAGRIGFDITPLHGLVIAPSVTIIGDRFSSAGERGRLAAYARFDVHAEYAVSRNVKVHARVENITDARYQDVLNYGTTGRAVYGGLTATW